MNVCNCALPALNGGSTKCCERCPNNKKEENFFGRYGCFPIKEEELENIKKFNLGK